MKSTMEGAGSVVQNNLVLYLDAINTRSYPGSGNTWYDLSGNKNNFTLINSPTFTGKYFNFGTSQYSQCVNTTCGNFSSGSFTIEYITYYTASTNQDVIAMKRSLVTTPGGANIPGWCFRNGASTWWVQDDNPGGTVNNFTNVVGSFALARQSTPVHMAYTIEKNGASTTGSEYKNGVLTYTDKKTFIGTNSINNASAMLIASNFTGSISMVRMYNTKLSAAEVKQNFLLIKSRYNL